MDEQSPRHYDASRPEPPPVLPSANSPAATPHAGDRWALRVVEPGRPDRFAEWHDRTDDDPGSLVQTTRHRSSAPFHDPSAPPSTHSFIQPAIQQATQPQPATEPARGCTLRLVTKSSGEADERSPACTFYRGATGPRVRAWSETVLLNGETIVDAEIQLGDRLAMGNLEFELIDIPSADRRINAEPLPCVPVVQQEEAADDPEPIKDDAAPTSCRASDVIPPRDHDDTEESVEEHLERLLKRVCGEDAARDFARQREQNLANLSSNTGGDGATSNSSRDHDKPCGSRRRVGIDLNGESDEEPADAAPSESVVRNSAIRDSVAARPVRPRDVEADWSGLRELANQSARAAIETHQMKGVARSARSRLSAAVLFAVSGTIGLYVIPGDQWLPLLGVLMAYGTTVLWLLRTLRGSRSSRRAPAR